MPRETSRAAPDADQDGQDRLARALRESVTAIAAIAPMLCEPDVKTTQVSQLLHGHIAQVVERKGLWLHVKGADEYPGWVHQGYVVTMPQPVPPLSKTGWDDPRPLPLGCTVQGQGSRIIPSSFGERRYWLRHRDDVSLMHPPRIFVRSLHVQPQTFPLDDLSDVAVKEL